MPQPQAQAQPRGNSAMTKFQPKRWQLQDQCGICGVNFSYMKNRHHCRHCGMSVCGKHSKNKVVVPTSLSKVPQRVCDRCYPVCRRGAAAAAAAGAAAGGAAPPPSRDLSPRPRRHTLEPRTDNDKDYGRRMRSPRDSSRMRQMDSPRRSNRTWNGDEDYMDARRPMPPHPVVRDRARQPQQGRERTKPSGHDRLMHPSRERERERTNPSRHDRPVQSSRERERANPSSHDRHAHSSRERRMMSPRASPAPSKERPMQPSRERRMRSPHASPAPPKERRRGGDGAPDPSRQRKHEQMRSPVPSLVKRGSKPRSENPSTCRTTSTTLSHLYADLNGNNNARAVPKKQRRQKEQPKLRHDSTFSIFSLAGPDSDKSDSESSPNGLNARNKAKRKPGKGRMGTTSRASLDKKEHLNFGASSSSVTSFEVSAITQKYLKPQPTKAAMQLTDLEPMIEEDSSESGDSIVKSTRAAKALASERKRAAVPSNPRNQDNKIRGAHPSSRAMLPPFRQPRDTFKADETYFRTSSEIRADPLRNDGKADESYFRTSSEIRADPLQNDGKSDDRKPSQNSGGKSSRTSSISDDEELRKDQASLSSSKCFSEDECFSGDEEETLANLITASKRQDRESVRAHKADIAGIGAGSAKTKPPTTTATYQLTKRDQDMLHHISELEARVLQYQKELPRLLDKYRASTEKAKTAQQELRESKARVHRYQKAYSTVARAIRTGRLYIQQKEYMAAILELARAAGIEKSNATLWYMLAECRLKISQPAAAEEACLTSLKLQPSGAGVALLGRILQERGRHDEAIQCYLSALGRNEENADDE